MNVAHTSNIGGNGSSGGGKRTRMKMPKAKKGKRQFKDNAELMDYIVSLTLPF